MLAGGLLIIGSLSLLLPDSLAADGQPASPDNRQAAIDYSDYQRGLRYFYAEQYEQALPFFVRAREEAASRAGIGSSEHAIALNNLGEVYRLMGRLDQAESLFRQALAIEETRLGANHQNLANPLNNLALVQRAQGDYAEAEQNLKRSLHIIEDSLGQSHPDVAGSLNNLARLYETTGLPERAQPLLERALRIAKDTLGTAHPTTKRVAANLERVNIAMISAGGATAMISTGGAMAEATASEAELPGDAPLAGASPADLLPPPPAPRATQAGAAPSPATAVAPEAPADAEENSETALVVPQGRPAGLRWARPSPGAFAIHLASVRSPTEASAEWQRLAEQFGVLETVQQLEPQRIETVEQGVFYRVLGGPFRSSDEAALACNVVRAHGGYCGVLRDGG